MRLVAFLSVVAIVICMAASHDASAAPASKVNICHLNSSNTSATYHFEYTDISPYSYSYDYTYAFGNVISVAPSAVAAHVAHGDSTAYGTVDASIEAFFETWDQYDFSYSDAFLSYSIDYGNADIKNADCYTFSFVYTGP